MASTGSRGRKNSTTRAMVSCGRGGWKFGNLGVFRAAADRAHELRSSGFDSSETQHACSWPSVPGETSIWNGDRVQ